MNQRTGNFSLVRKLLTLLCLALILQIPVAFVSNLIAERTVTKELAAREVQRISGGEQTVAGPLLSVPVVRDEPTPLVDRTAEPIEVLGIFPDELSIRASAELSSRYRGIFQIPVYRVRVKLEGTFTLVPDWDLPPASRLELSQSALTVAVGEVRGVLEDAELVWDGSKHQFEAGSTSSYFPSGMSVRSLPPEALSPGTHSFSVELYLSGSRALRFLPAGASTHASMDANWGDPSFVGAYLPAERVVEDRTFSASWRVPQLARTLPRSFFESRRDSVREQEIRDALFGVAFVTPVDVHRMASRAVKYDLLFVSLTFLAVLSCEILFGLRLHVIQYGLLGAALTLFYLLLLSLSEHLGFAAAYLAASALVTALVAGYCRAVLGKPGRARLIGALLGALYLYLYVLLREDDLSLLFGSLGLTVILGAIMYLTRSIDWYELTSRGGTAEAQGAGGEARDI